MKNKEKIKTIYAKYALDLYRYGYSVLKSHEDAEDLVATVFEKLLKLEKINDETIKSWLFTVAHNLMMDKFKATKTLVQIDEEKINGLSDNGITPESEIILKEEVEIIKDELEKLPSEQKEVLILKTWEDYKFYEIATILGSSENTVKSHYYRALKTLKVNIQRDHGKKFAFAFPILVMSLSLAKSTIPNLLSKQIMANLLTSATTAGVTAASTMPIKALMIGIATVVTTATIGGGVYLYNRNNEPDAVDQQNTQIENSTNEIEVEEEDVKEPVISDPQGSYDFDDSTLGLRMLISDDLKPINDFWFKSIAAYEYIGPHSVSRVENQTDAENDRMLVVITDSLDLNSGDWTKVEGGITEVDGVTAQIYEYTGAAEFNGIAHVFTHKGKQISVITEVQRYYISPSDGPDTNDSETQAAQDKAAYELEMESTIESIDLY